MRNTLEQYGLISRSLHWIIALLFFGMFILGLSMEELAEDNRALNHQLLNLHSSFGILLGVLVTFRMCTSQIQIHPNYPATMKTWEIKVANTMKKALNILLILLPISGYLSLTSKGVAPTFLEIEMPLIITESHNLHEVMEETHELLALSVMGLVLLHATAAFKHHFLNKDDTLLKMLGKVKN